MSSIALRSWIESYHRRVKSNIGSHADQIDLTFVGGSAGFNQESNPRLGGRLLSSAKRHCRAVKRMSTKNGGV